MRAKGNAIEHGMRRTPSRESMSHGLDRVRQAAKEQKGEQFADLWRRILRRRCQKGAVTWERMTVLQDRWLPKPRITHPWPEKRFAVKHSRWEAGAGIPSAGICAGARGNACLHRDPRPEADVSRSDHSRDIRCCRNGFVSLWIVNLTRPLFLEAE